MIAPHTLKPGFYMDKVVHELWIVYPDGSVEASGQIFHGRFFDIYPEIAALYEPKLEFLGEL